VVLMDAVIHRGAAVPISSAPRLIDKQNGPRKCFVINTYSKKASLMQEWNMFILQLTLHQHQIVLHRKHNAPVGIKNIKR
jgi:hypothetical protein